MINFLGESIIGGFVLLREGKVPKFLEDKLKAEYGADSKVPYKVMNSIGAMRGSKITKKGLAMQKKHDRDVKLGKAK